MKKEIVISAYDKDIQWLHNINNETKKTIYRKGNILNSEFDEIILEPNKGRCVHTFFNHIVNNYNNMSDITFFVQDFPFDHWGEVLEVINDNTWDDRYSLKINGYYGFHNNKIGSAWHLDKSTHFKDGNILKCYSNGIPQDLNPNINVDFYWDLLFDEPKPNMYEFMPGGHFGITKEHVQKRSLEFYKKISNLLLENENTPWNIERLECYIFDDTLKTKF
jgi:hypothetical protein